MVVLLVSFGLPLGQAQVGLAQEQVHPNIILILADDMRADDLRLMPKVQSRLMEKGMTFSNAFVTDPLCCPSRATILTGRYAHNHGVRGNEPIRGGFATFHDSGLEQRTVAVRLREAGYRTALFGKLLNGYCNPDQGCETGRDYVPPGWTDWHAWSGSRILNDNGTLHDFPDDSLVKDDVVRARVSRLLESWSASKPLFLYVSAKAPHGGTDVAERHASLFAEESLDRGGSFNEADLSDKPSYVRESGHLTESEVAKLEAYHRTRLRRLMAVDDLVGRVVAELEQKGELDNTYIFFTSDNGYLLGEHRLAYIKRVPYE
jgi:N-acetylglucosamine-6-sulfatase